MFRASDSHDPVVLSYLTLRKAVGIVALGLPFAMAIPWWILRHELEISISSYYYTGMRNLFVGSLCAIAVFMLCARGYDQKDEIAGTCASLCALGVAFLPTAPDRGATHRQLDIGVVHYTFAAVLFSFLAYFCLILFKTTAKNREPTPQKILRNRIYTICGYVIIVSILLIVISKVVGIPRAFGSIGPVFYFESVALIAFGIAWLTKGETFLKDAEPAARTSTTRTLANKSSRVLSGRSHT
jgi:hypothetical protein